MRLFRPRRHLDRDECREIVAAVAAFSAMSRLVWKVAEGDPEQSVATLAERLVRARRDGSVFELPANSRFWFDLRYDHPDTGHALALVLVWSFAVTRLPDGTASGDHVRVATWQLRHFLPPSAHGTLADIEGAFCRHRDTSHVRS